MKKLMIFNMAIVAMFASHSIYAQRVMNDPSYSTNNYKHPNKAAYMKKVQEEQPVIYLEEIKDEDENSGNNLIYESNYKGMNASATKIKKYRRVNAPIIYPVIVPASSGNYKQQFSPGRRNSRSNENKFKKEPVV